MQISTNPYMQNNVLAHKNTTSIQENKSSFDTFLSLHNSDTSKAQEVLSKAESVVLIDNPQEKSYPMPIIATDRDETYVGRVRVDNYDKSILHLWCVADQIRVGAATNAVRIAQKWIAMQGE